MRCRSSPTVMSADKDQDPDIAAMIGTSAALAISGIPFAMAHMGAARVGYKDGTYLLNPGYAKRSKNPGC